MKELTGYKRNGFEFAAIWRKDDVVAFIGVKDETNKTWEIMHVRKSKAGMRFGKHFEASEHGPSNNEWGTYGFTATNEADAYKIFERELSKAKERNETKRSRPN